MSRFERWIYVVLAVVILVWPGVRRQFFLQIRQITHTTDVRVGDWPKFSTIYEYALPVPANKLKRVAAKHKEWEGLAELLNTEGRYGDRPDAAAVAKAFDEALAADPDSRVVHARFLPLHLRQIDFYRAEERALDQKLGRKPGPYPAGISEKQAQSALDWVLSGEKLDPQNSYYDYVLALIYLGLHKDDEAIAAINADSRKPVFNTYDKEAKLNARRLLMEAGVPGLEATNNQVTSFGELARLRRLARTLQAIALDAEANGDWQRGWKIRFAGFRMGNHLISAGQEYITPLVGTAIQGIAVGELPRTAEQAQQLKRSGNDRDAQAKVIVQIVRDYSTKHQLGSEGNWVASQYMAGHEFRRLNRGLLEKNSDIYRRWQYSELMRYGAVSILVEMLIVLVILGILSLPRRLRTAEGGRLAKIVGAIGAGLTIAGLFIVSFYAQRAWSNMQTPLPARLTWEIIGILPAVIFAGAIVVLIRRGAKSALVSLRTSARYALPVIAIAYVVLSGVLAIERGAFEKRALQSIEQGLEPKQIEILKKTGFRR